MSPIDLKGVTDPELVIGLVGPLGVPIQQVSELVQTSFSRVDYTSEAIRLSRFLDAYESLPTAPPAPGAGPAERWNILMSRGNELREKLGRGDALAIHVAADIASRRPDQGTGSRALEKQAFILRQLKHPEEVHLLRQVYGEAFHLIGIYTPEKTRNEYLRNVKSLTPDEADDLIERDAGEEIQYGQQVTKTYHLADLFIEVPGWTDHHLQNAGAQINRYVDLLFGHQIITPSVDEYGMYLAHSAALRSADLSRQVGAAILTKNGEVLAVGANEVPKAGGGQYWDGEDDDRDFVRGYDSNEVLKLQSVREVLEKLDPEWDEFTDEEKDDRAENAADTLSSTRLMNLTEFGRAVHAEMEAILSAVRVGVSVKDHTLYSTTFPCHNCAKHIVGAGISKVLYVEPYPKSLANRLHQDAIAFSLQDDEQVGGSRMPFQSFVGVAPRRFQTLFSMIGPHGVRIRRKQKDGTVRTKPVGLRTFATPLSHVEREGIVASYLLRVIEDLTQLNLELE